MKDEESEWDRKRDDMNEEIGFWASNSNNREKRGRKKRGKCEKTKRVKKLGGLEGAIDRKSVV